MQKNRILILAPTPFSQGRGCHLRILYQARALIALGHEVLLLTYPVGETPAGISVRRTQQIFAQPIRMGVGFSWHRLYLDPLLLLLAYQQLRSFEPDLIYAHLHEGALIAFILKKIKRANFPIIVDLQGRLSAELKSYAALPNILTGPIDKFELFLLTRVDLVVVSNPQLLDGVFSKALFLPDTTPLPKSTSKVDSGKVDTDHKKRGTRLLRMLRLDAHTPIVVYAGNFSLAKGTKQLVTAVSLLRQRGTLVQLLILGGGDEEPLKKLIATSKIADCVRIKRGQLKNLWPYLQISHVAVDPKLSIAKEGSGKILAYQAVGLPIVCFDHPTNRHYLRSYAFFASEQGDTAKNLSEAIQTALTNPVLANAKAQQAKLYFQKHFSPAAHNKRLAFLLDLVR